MRTVADTRSILRSLLFSLCFLTAALSLAQQPIVPVRRPRLPEPEPENASPKTVAPAGPTAGSVEPVLPGDWAPELLWSILSSPNPEASRSLYDAAFAAGPSLLPQLQAALKDDRTATFAAQCLAYMGGGEALKILAGLIDDPRDLDLRRFYFGALGEYRAPEANKVLLYALRRSDAEPDRTVTEAAIMALTVRSDPSFVPSLRDAEKSITDVVIHDDLENAIEVIEERARYLASPAGRKAGGSVEEAVRTYFMPALEAARPPAHPATPTAPKAAHAPAAESLAKIEVRGVTLSPDKDRALAHVTLEAPDATAKYDIVLQKRAGDWSVVSAWLGTETEKQ